MFDIMIKAINASIMLAGFVAVACMIACVG